MNEVNNFMKDITILQVVNLAAGKNQLFLNK